MIGAAQLRTEAPGDVMIAHLGGEVDASNRAPLLESLLDALANDCAGLVLDLRETSYLDSAGIELILRLAEELRARRQILRLVVAPDSFVSDVLEAVRLSERVSLHQELDAAVAAVGSRRS